MADPATNYNIPGAHVLLGDDMARRRLQRSGDLTSNNGFWWLRWREDRTDENGDVQRVWTKRIAIAPAEGTGKKTKREAKRIAWEQFLSRHDNNQQFPGSMMSLRDFIQKRFVPQHVAMQKPTTQSYLKSIIDRHILPTLGDKRLGDVRTADIQDLIRSKMAEEYKPSRKKDGNRRYSTRILYSIKNTISAIYSFADRVEAFSDRNPAARVMMPELSPVRNLSAPSGPQVRALLNALPEPAHGMALTASLTGMNIAEVCGLRWAWVNLSDSWRTIDGESIPPMSLAVRYQWVRGKYASVKQPKRRRIIPLPIALAVYLLDREGPADAPVFAGSTGRPVDEHNVRERVLKPAATKLGMPWLGWHSLRRSLATRLDEQGASVADRMASLGHAEAEMTMHYTRSDIERRREVLEKIAEGMVQ